MCSGTFIWADGQNLASTAYTNWHGSFSASSTVASSDCVYLDLGDSSRWYEGDCSLNFPFVCMICKFSAPCGIKMCAD